MIEKREKALEPGRRAGCLGGSLRSGDTAIPRQGCKERMGDEYNSASSDLLLTSGTVLVLSRNSKSFVE